MEQLTLVGMGVEKLLRGHRRTAGGGDTLEAVATEEVMQVRSRRLEPRALWLHRPSLYSMAGDHGKQFSIYILQTFSGPFGWFYKWGDKGLIRGEFQQGTNTVLIHLSTVSWDIPSWSSRKQLFCLGSKDIHAIFSWHLCHCLNT